MATGTRFNTASGTDTTFGSDTLAVAQAEDLAMQPQITQIVSVTGATATLTAAQAVNTIVTCTTQSTCTVTMPTAASVVASLVNVQVGSSFDMQFINSNSGTLTLAGGTGGTIVGTATVATSKNQLVKGVVTNATIGSEAVSYYTMSIATGV